MKRVLIIWTSFWATSLLFGDTVDQPNVLFISVDDLNDWIGCLEGHPQAFTPNMDRLAERGVLFSNAHCAAPACNPSRAAVFSGMMPDKTGVWSNNTEAIDRAMPEALLLSQAFEKAGYATLGTGKLLHKNGKKFFQEYYETNQRWSPFDKNAVNYTAEELPTKGTDNPRHIAPLGKEEYVLPLNRMPSDRSPENKKGESFDWGAFEVPDEAFGDTRITDWAIQKLKYYDGEKPLFLGVGYYRPHIPLYAPARFFERFKDDPGRLPEVKLDDLDDVSEVAQRWAREAITAGSHDTVLKYDQWRQAVEAYLACVTYVDYEIGRLLNVLDSSDSGGNTLIVLWSDHGWHLGEKEHWGKWTGWERSTRVPMIIVPPRSMRDSFAKGGEVCEQPVGLIDLYPTLTDLCGVEAPEGLDGISLRSLLRSPLVDTGRKLLTQFDEGNVSIRSKRWRYIKYADGSEELYDLEKDPQEWVNLAGKKAFGERLEAFRSFEY